MWMAMRRREMKGQREGGCRGRSDEGGMRNDGWSDRGCCTADWQAAWGSSDGRRHAPMCAVVRVIVEAPPPRSQHPSTTLPAVPLQREDGG